MKTLSRKVFVLTLLVLPVSFGSFEVAAQQKTQQVKIYLRKSLDKKYQQDPYDEKNPFGLHPVMRQVPANAPLRSALEALMLGPTTTEEAGGVLSSTFGLKLLSVRIRNGTAYTRFTQPPGAAFPGDAAPFIFADAVERTAKQFSTVKKVFVCLDGVLNFGDESGERPKRCPR